MTWTDGGSDQPPVWQLGTGMKISVTPEQASRLRAQGVREDFLQLAMPADAQAWEVGAFDQAEAETGDPGMYADGWAYAAEQLTPAELDQLLGAAAELDAMGLANAPEPDPATGLNRRGVAIYRKLIKKGFPAARALAFARNAQRARPGQAPALSNTDDGALELSYQHFLKAFAGEMAEYAAAEGDYGTAVQTMAELGMDGIELANGSYATVAELSNAAHERESQRAAEDAGPLAARSEDRLARALSRAARGTLVTRQPSLADFASPSAAARQLAEHRWRQDHADYDGAVTGGEICGHVDDLGRCGARYHSPGCSGLADAAIGTALAESGAYARISGQPVTDAAGTTWDTTMGGWLEASTGMRQAQSGWADSRRELASVRRVPVFGDPEDDGSPGEEFPASTRAVAAALAAQAGLTVRSADEIRAAASQEQAARMAHMLMTGRARPRPDEGESMRERAARMRQPVIPVPFGQPDDGLRGALPQYVNGAL